MATNRQDFVQFRDYLEEISGIYLPDNKEYLIATRLRKILQNRACASLRDLLQLLRSRPDRNLCAEIIDAMTTNETFWFRDNYPFDYFQKTLLPKLLDEKIGKVRIWCAACSSGQEPYSLAMIIDEVTAPGGRYAGR